jgi:hypothetical protein
MRVSWLRAAWQICAVCAIAVLTVETAGAVSVSRFGAAQSTPSAISGSSTFSHSSALLTAPGAAFDNGGLSSAAAIRYDDVDQPQYVLGPWGVPILVLPAPPSPPPPAPAVIPGPATVSHGDCGRILSAPAPPAVSPPPAPVPAAPKSRWTYRGSPSPQSGSSAPQAAREVQVGSSSAGVAREYASSRPLPPSAKGWPQQRVAAPPAPALEPVSAPAPAVAALPCPALTCVAGPGDTLTACPTALPARTALPAPASLALIGSGLIGVVGLRWARRRRA